MSATDVGPATGDDPIYGWVLSALLNHSPRLDARTLRAAVINISDAVASFSDYKSGPILQGEIAMIGGKVIDGAALASEEYTRHPHGAYPHEVYHPSCHHTAVVGAALVVAAFMMAAPDGSGATRQQLDAAYDSICQAVYAFEGRN